METRFTPRSRRVETETKGSPEFIYINPATNQNENWIVNCFDTNPEGSTAQIATKYLPYNWYKVVNKSGSTIYFYRNMSLNQLTVIPDNSISIISGKGLHSFRIVPTTANAAINTIWVSGKREEMTSDKFFRDLSKNAFVRGLLGY